MLNKLLYKWHYFLVLVFPLLFIYLFKSGQIKSKEAEAFQFYTSVKGKHLTSLSFCYDGKPLVSWQGPLEFYKQIDYYEQKRSLNENLCYLKIEHSGAGDTILFLAINFLIDGNVYTLSPEQFSTLGTSTNCKILNDNEQLKLVSTNSEAIGLDLKTPLSWESSSISIYKIIFLVSISLLFLIVVLYFKPDIYRFVTCFCISLFLFFYLWFMGKDPSAQISINDFRPNQATNFFFNEIPVFQNQLSVEYNDTSDIRHTQAQPDKYSFYRINLQDTIRSLRNTELKYQMGLLNKTWKMRELKPYQINGNALDYGDKNFSTTPNDAFICLTSTEFNKQIKLLDFLRTSLYSVFTLLVFGLCLFFSSRLIHATRAQLLLCLSFLAICFFTPLIHLFDATRLIMNEEKRLASPLLPPNDSTILKDYMKQVDNYMKDQLPGRSQLIVTNNLIKYKIFSELATNPMVYFGKENWMFYIGENVKEVYENKRLYTEDELKKMTLHLEERRDWLKERGINYYVLFPRLSHYFYQEKVGNGLYQYIKKPRLEQFMEYLQAHSSVNVIDVYQPMLKAKQSFKRDLYYHSDSHWNLFGAYFAYEAVIKRIQKDYPKLKSSIPLKEIIWSESESDEADLSKLISLSGVITRHEFIPIHPDVNNMTPVAAPHYPEYRSVHSLLVYEGKDSLAPRMLMNRDSYSNFLIPYFSKHFSRQTYVWSPLFFPTIIEQEKPDIVITEMMERFVNDLLIDNPPLAPKH